MLDCSTLNARHHSVSLIVCYHSAATAYSSTMTDGSVVVQVESVGAATSSSSPNAPIQVAGGLSL
jgi:hypothetical protein